jgi:trans-aconitate 2-methyltransferase
MSAWSATDYLRFGDERTRPCRDLAARIGIPHPRRIIDLGCGPGNSTSVLAGRWPDADLTGLDSSREMLAAAEREHPAMRWMRGEIAEWIAERGPAFDIVFSNAALQWVDDHASVFPGLLRRVAEGGVLAVQVPSVSDSPSQRGMREMAASPAWRGRFVRPVADWHSEEPSFYYDVLAPHASRLDIWRSEYMHVLDGPEGIVEWYRSTALRPFLGALPGEAERSEFTAEYLERMRAAYSRRANGKVLFPFLRTFVIAYR